jgi:hypothetical protein
MNGVEITGDPGKGKDIRFGDRFAEGCLVPDFYIRKILLDHRSSQCFVGASCRTPLFRVAQDKTRKNRKKG